MTNIGRFNGWVNPLAFLEVDEPWSDLPPSAPLSAEAVLAYACHPGSPTDPIELAQRYRRISTEQVRLFVAPNEPRILEKLVWPLRHAKASYMVGNTIGVIALTGMVAEMVAVLCWQLGEVHLNGRLMTSAEETSVFGSAFERLGQDRRVKVLEGYGLVTPETVRAFDTIRSCRRRYLHLWSQDHDALDSDAIACFQAAVALVVGIIGQEIVDGAVKLNPRLVKYLQRTGLVQPLEDTEEEQADGTV